MKNWNIINKESNTITALVVLCQDYVTVDEEFMSNHKIKRNLQNPEFWIEMAHSLRGAIALYIQQQNDCISYDEYEDSEVSDAVIANFALNPSNRFELNDIICDAVESWLKHF